MKTTTKPTFKQKFGISIPFIFLLAALTLPRTLGHDLHLVDQESIINQLLIFVPFIIWVGYVLFNKLPKPFVTLVLIGLAYGLLLAIVHQFFLTEVWEGVTPATKAKLDAALSPTAQQILSHASAFISSLIVGTLTGVILGGITAGCKVLFGNRPKPGNNA